MTAVDADQDRIRMLEIDRYRVLVDPPRTDLLAIVAIAAQVAEVPMAAINLITVDEQHQVATAGFDAAVCAREDSMCNVAIRESSPVIVADARRDVRFRDNPFVTGEIGLVRFYASHQLRTPDGVIIGTLCVFAEEPRTLSAEQETALGQLADRVVDVLELELRSRELHQTVEELQRTRVELERSNAALQAFAGQVSHDLRNPMTGMDLSLSMIAEELAAAPPEAAASDDLPFLVERARASLGRMQVLVDDLLAFARVGGSRNDEEVDLARLMDDVRHDLAAQLEDADVEVEPLPRVGGDAALLRSVLQNLVANAAAYVAPGERPRILVREAEHPHGVAVEVVDHGLGIAPEHRERVFEPLVRVHKQIPGSGIGLATVRRIMDGHGGHVTIHETPGGGTTVRLEFPDLR